MLPPPTDIFPRYNYSITPPRADRKDVDTYEEVKSPINSKRAKREAFMVCGLISAVNEAFAFYKRQACGKDGAKPGNFNMTYTIHDDPTDY